MKKILVHIVRFQIYQSSSELCPSTSFIAMLLYLMIIVPVEHKKTLKVFKTTKHKRWKEKKLQWTWMERLLTILKVKKYVPRNWQCFWNKKYSNFCGRSTQNHKEQSFGINLHPFSLSDLTVQIQVLSLSSSEVFWEWPRFLKEIKQKHEL